VPLTKREKQLEKDILILVLRLMSEPIDSFAPESAEVMERWMDKAKEVLEGRREI
jgi:Na+-transporting methylmalonyl-CoA/oxaloacetate decarboxylase gamma subunit